MLDASGRYVVPGFIDAHMHLESTKLLVDEFARLVLPLGTTAVVADPHEIANVLGTDGVHWLLDVCAGLPLDVYFMASSCVPASAFESPRRPLTPRRPPGPAPPPPRARPGRDDELPRRHRRRRGGAREARARAAPSTSTATRPGVLGKAAEGVRGRRDPLRPRGARRSRRVASGCGPGMWVLIREASVARNLRALAPARRRVRAAPARLLHRRPRARARRRGRPRQLDRARRGRARRRARGRARAWPRSTRPTWHRLDHLGAIAPGYQADLLAPARPRALRPGGRAQGGAAGRRDPARRSSPTGSSARSAIAPVGSNDFHVPWAGGKARVIGLVPGQIVTESLVEELTVEDGARGRRSRARPGQGRRRRAPPRHRPHRARLRPRLRPASAARSRRPSRTTRTTSSSSASTTATWRAPSSGSPSSAAASSSSRAAACAPSCRCRSPVCSSEAPAAEVAERVTRLRRGALAALGCTVEAPFQALAFLALSVIPSLKLTDQGLVDVDAFRLVPLADGLAAEPVSARHVPDTGRIGPDTVPDKCQTLLRSSDREVPGTAR